MCEVRPCGCSSALSSAAGSGRRYAAHVARATRPLPGRQGQLASARPEGPAELAGGARKGRAEQTEVITTLTRRLGRLDVSEGDGPRQFAAAQTADMDRIVCCW